MAAIAVYYTKFWCMVTPNVATHVFVFKIDTFKNIPEIKPQEHILILTCVDLSKAIFHTNTYHLFHQKAKLKDMYFKNQHRNTYFDGLFWFIMIRWFCMQEIRTFKSQTILHSYILKAPCLIYVIASFFLRYFHETYENSCSKF